MAKQMIACIYKFSLEKENNKMAKLEGKVALITGAAVGLGEGISTAYAKYGAKLIMVDLSPAVEDTAERLRKEYGAEIITVVANVADRAQMDAAR